MSGPKTSVLSPNFTYYWGLTEAARAEWAEKEILVSLRAMQESETIIAALLGKAEMLLEGEKWDEGILKVLEEARSARDFDLNTIDENTGFSDKELREIRKSGAEDVSGYRNVTPDSVGLEGKYLAYFQSIRDRDHLQKTNIARACAKQSAEMKKTIRRLELACREIETVKQERLLMEGVGTSFYIPFRSVRNRSEAEGIIGKINDALFGVSSLILTDRMLEQLEIMKDQAAEIKEASALSGFYQLVVRPFVRECTEYDAFYNAHSAEYEEYRSSYLILCEELGLVPQEMEFSAEAIDFYKTKTGELQEILIKRRTREAVMQTVNEVMTEMGYDLVASRDVQKRSGKQYHDELYIYGEGTAISVVHSSDGQLTMEIGGLDYGDRAPTDEEAREMSRQMVSFCMDYAAIADALKKKGLDMKKVSMLPPDEQYATIINLDDYEVTGKVGTITEAKKKQQQKAESAKELHAED